MVQTIKNQHLSNPLSNEAPQSLETIKKNYPLQTRGTKKSKKTIERMVAAKKETNYYWTNLQNKKYVEFLAVNHHLFSLSHLERRKQKINLQMSKRIRTRTPTQCHTHHQKMMKKFGSISNILEGLQIPKGTIQQNQQRMPEMNHLTLNQPASSQVQEIAHQHEKKLETYVNQICTFSFVPLGNQLLLGRFQDLEQEQFHNWHTEQQLQQWMN